MPETVVQAEQVLWCITHNCGRPKVAEWDRYYDFMDVVCVEYSIRVAAEDPSERPERCRMIEALLVPRTVTIVEPWLPEA